MVVTRRAQREGGGGASKSRICLHCAGMQEQKQTWHEPSIVEFCVLNFWYLSLHRIFFLHHFGIIDFSYRQLPTASLLHNYGRDGVFSNPVSLVSQIPSNSFGGNTVAVNGPPRQRCRVTDESNCQA